MRISSRASCRVVCSYFNAALFVPVNVIIAESVTAAVAVVVAVRD